MPNQLAKTKRRKSLAEHEMVLFALEEIAREEKTSTMDLMRQAIRELIRKHTNDYSQKSKLQAAIMRFSPQIPQDFSTPSQLSRFKRQQREFDKIILELNLVNPESVEARNSIVSPQCKIRILELE